jgi:polyphosphate kinase
MNSRSIPHRPSPDASSSAANDGVTPAIPVDLSDSRLYINRELSQLQFNIRVLDQALDERTPLLERLKFLLIFSRNMDEFFEIRVAGLKGQIALDHEMIGPDSIPPRRALAEISDIAHKQIERQYTILNESILPALVNHGIRIVRRTQWSHKQKLWVGCYQFRLTRNADLSLDPEDVEDLALALRGELYSRRFGDAVRLEVADNCPKDLTDNLLKQFGLSESELYEVNGPVNLARLFSIATDVSYPQLQYPVFTPALPKVLKHAEDLFQVIGKQDVLLLHPYESFSPVVDMLRQAAKDPQVLAIKQTLYRTNAKSEIVDALVDAARSGKEVTAVVELRARFDEESNLSLASRLQQAGAMVIYGVVGIKTHAKLMLIQRREGRDLVRYAHMGTGNYHTGNARLYTDYSLLTSDEVLCEDVHKLFSQLTGMGKVLQMKKLLHAPFTLKKVLIEMIEREATHAAAGKPARIIIKINSLTEPKVIRALYKASMAGVSIDLIVRGVCCLRPGVEGVSENIRVRSIIGRFLEHSRVYWFANDGEPKLYLSSADLMERNLDRRVETAFPIEGKKLQQRVLQALELYLSDNSSSLVLQPDGQYLALSSNGSDANRNVQNELLEKLCGAGSGR